jgi:hypothetical protein
MNKTSQRRDIFKWDQLEKNELIKTNRMKTTDIFCRLNWLRYFFLDPEQSNTKKLFWNFRALIKNSKTIFFLRNVSKMLI